MKVYHGSYLKIDKIDLSKCETNRDFGQAFYVTSIFEQAESWAKRKGRSFGGDGYVTEFTYLEHAVENFHLKILRFGDYTEEWMDFVVANRNLHNPAPVHDYDIVEGPVANDDITRRIDAYLRGSISRADFLEELKYDKHPTHQIAFCTVKSLQMLEHSGQRMEWTIEDTGNAIISKLLAEHGIEEPDAYDLYYNSATFAHLVDGSSDPAQQDWADVYELLIQELNLSGG
jgi:hypothetical protein